MKRQLKHYWWAPVAMAWLIAMKIWVFDAFIVLKQQQALLVQKEQDVVPYVEQSLLIEETIDKLKKVKQVKQLYERSDEINGLLNDIIAPNRFLQEHVTYQLDLGKQYQTELGIICPIQLDLESSFNYIGDYLEYVESIYLPWWVRSIQIRPAKYEFDRIRVQLTGNILLFQ
jgi:hypothetical protein